MAHTARRKQLRKHEENSGAGKPSPNATQLTFFCDPDFAILERCEASACRLA
jgi:hypothetical protein